MRLTRVRLRGVTIAKLRLRAAADKTSAFGIAVCVVMGILIAILILHDLVNR